MSITTYDELKTAIQDWLGDRSDLSGFIPDYITMAEASLNRSLRHPEMETRATVTVDTSDTEPQFIDLPTGFQSMRRIWLSEVEGAPALNFKSEAQITRYRTSIGNAVGIPLFFTVFGTEIELCPTPDTDYVLEMVYRGNIPALSDDNTTNWLLTIAPDVYLYGALAQAGPFTRDTESTTLWLGSYRIALEELIQHGRKLKYGPTPMHITLAGEVTP